MKNPELSSQEGQEEPKEPQEQMPERILERINDAIENGRELLFILKTEKGRLTTNLATPTSIKGRFLTVESQGYHSDIEIDSISAVSSSEE